MAYSSWWYFHDRSAAADGMHSDVGWKFTAEDDGLQVGHKWRTAKILSNRHDCVYTQVSDWFTGLWVLTALSWNFLQCLSDFLLISHTKQLAIKDWTRDIMWFDLIGTYAYYLRRVWVYALSAGRECCTYIFNPGFADTVNLAESLGQIACGNIACLLEHRLVGNSLLAADRLGKIWMYLEKADRNKMHKVKRYWCDAKKEKSKEREEKRKEEQRNISAEQEN